MPRASDGSSFAWLSTTMRLMVFSQFSGVARRYEMRDIRILSSDRWHEPHFARTSSLVTGMPSSAGGDASAAAGSCARDSGPTARNTATAIPRTLCPFMKNPFGDQQRQAPDHVGQRHWRTTLTVGIEQLGHAAMPARHLREFHEIDVTGKPHPAGERLLADDLAAANDRPLLEADVVRIPQIQKR